MEDNNNNTPTTTGQNMPNASEQSIGNNHMDFGDEISKLLSTAGTLQVNQQQSDIIFAPVAPNEVLVKPDGLVYLSWTKYASRLSRAFGTSWGLVPQGMPKMSNNNLVVWPFHLIIKGVYCGFAIGEQEYIPSNKRMTYGEACEGAKSNALTRLCKALGIGLELWDKAFVNTWLNSYTDKKWEDGKSPDQKGRYVYSLKQGAFSGMSQPNNQTRYVAPIQVFNTNTPTPVEQVFTNTDTTTTTTGTPVVKEPATVSEKPAVVTEPAKEPVTTTTTETKEVVKEVKEPTTTPATEEKKPIVVVKDNAKPAGKKDRLYTGKASTKNIPENNNFLNEKGSGIGIKMEAIGDSEKIDASTSTPATTPAETAKPVVTTTKPATTKNAAKTELTPAVVNNTVEINGITFNEENEPEDPYMNLLFQHWKKIVQAKTTGLLKAAYDQVKYDYNNGKIVEDHKEILRKLSNKLFVGLSASGKG